MSRQPRDPARRTAYDVVHAVATAGVFANLLLPRLLRERRLDERDAAFATELAYGTLRWQGSLDVVLARCADRSLDRIDDEALACLRLGAYQLLRMRVPSHAAVAATVDLVREVAGPRPAGFVNAVLRRAAGHDWDGWIAALAPVEGADRLALSLGFPRWILDFYTDALGGDRTEAAAALAEDRPRTHLVARPGRITREELVAASGGEPGLYSPYAVRTTGGDPAALAAVRDGRAAVQDEGSQVTALALAQAPITGADARWLDVCAGPGGKAALLAGVAAQRDARLLAVDRQPHRARLVARALAGAPAATVVADGTRPAWRDGTFDRVLVDVPCSGLGALRRRPELRWRRTPDDVVRLGPLQRRLLERALDAVRSGGVVAYVTCSPHRAETQAVVAAVTASRDDVATLDTPALLGIPDVGSGPGAQLWPHRHGTDAMFVALLRRT